MCVCTSKSIFLCVLLFGFRLFLQMDIPHSSLPYLSPPNPHSKETHMEKCTKTENLVPYKMYKFFMIHFFLFVFVWDFRLCLSLFTKIYV